MINHDMDQNGKIEASWGKIGGDTLRTIYVSYSFLCNNKLNGGRTYTNGIPQIEGLQAGALISE